MYDIIIVIYQLIDKIIHSQLIVVCRNQEIYIKYVKRRITKLDNSWLVLYKQIIVITMELVFNFL